VAGGLDERHEQRGDVADERVTISRDVPVEPRGEDLAQTADERGRGGGADRIGMGARRPTGSRVLHEERHQLVAGIDPAAVHGLVAEGLDIEDPCPPLVIEDEGHDGRHGGADLRWQVRLGAVEGADELGPQLVEEAVVDRDHEGVEVVEALVEVPRVEVVRRADGPDAGARPALAGQQVEGRVEQQLTPLGTALVGRQTGEPSTCARGGHQGRP
jgi:hypothetical protein